VLAECSGQSAPRACLRGAIALAGGVGEIAGAGRVCWETAAHARKRASYPVKRPQTNWAGDRAALWN